MAAEPFQERIRRRLTAVPLMLPGMWQRTWLQLELPIDVKFRLRMLLELHILFPFQ